MSLSRAYHIAAKHFDCVKDDAGRPYFEHCLAVKNGLMFENLFTGEELEELHSIAVLHDIIEDTKVNAIGLSISGFSQNIVNSVVLLTKVAGEEYRDYIDRICNSNNMMAKIVKLSDLTHNMDLARITNREPSEYELERNLKYKFAFSQIMNDLLFQLHYESPFDVQAYLKNFKGIAIKYETAVEWFKTNPFKYTGISGVPVFEFMEKLEDKDMKYVSFTKENLYFGFASKEHFEKTGRIILNNTRLFFDIFEALADELHETKKNS